MGPSRIAGTLSDPACGRGANRAFLRDTALTPWIEGFRSVAAPRSSSGSCSPVRLEFPSTCNCNDSSRNEMRFFDRN